jgi:DTW domain-containing protein YfiP
MKEDVKTVIILDGTWDQAKKMFVRSPDLHKVKRLQLALRYICFQRLIPF